ncbi:hypothetical protein [Microbacter margulisiae]|uniref:Outer membrane protein beta-barrel domain-containing protein n=1 Tax=Microbacter margulisiae TaxID=1350067 RepID=A0A7W5DSQ6_9PORP|nr:hypothetical protein [Microbacter margulisiae]MBB3188380.1 hypothetical protein [Microbacter margulisiae]
MKRKLIFLFIFIAAVSGLAAQSQFISQDRDPKKNSDLYFIPEINYGYGFLATNYPLYNLQEKAVYDSYSPMSYSVAMNIGYYFTPNYSAGVGVAYERYMQPNANSLPLYIDLRGYLKDAKNTPFAFVKLGDSFSWWRAFEAGEWMHIGVGYKFFMGKQCFTASLGYELKHVGHWKTYSTIDQINAIPNRWAGLNRNAITFNIGWVIL